MPVVQIEMIEGRTVEQKRQLVAKITDVIVETTNAKPEAVTVIIRDMKKHDIGKAGKLQSDV